MRSGLLLIHSQKRTYIAIGNQCRFNSKGSLSTSNLHQNIDPTGKLKVHRDKGRPDPSGLSHLSTDKNRIYAYDTYDKSTRYRIIHRQSTKPQRVQNNQSCNREACNLSFIIYNFSANSILHQLRRKPTNKHHIADNLRQQIDTKIAQKA